MEISNTKSEASLLNVAIAWALGYFFLSSVMIVIVRHLSLGIHPTVVFFFRNLLAAPFLLVYFFFMGKEFLRSNRHFLHLVRAFINCVAIIVWFYAVTITPLAEAVTLSFTSPLFATFIAMVFLKENVEWHKWLGLLAGFIGVVVVLRPGIDVLQTGALLVLLVSVLLAISTIILKRLNTTDHPALPVLYFIMFSIPASFPLAWTYWETPSGNQWFWLVSISVCTILAQFSISKAVQKADISKLAPYDFSRLIFTAVIAYLVFYEIPDFYTVLGAIIIIASSTYANYYDRKINKSV